jgi:DNA-directed RNA polymerase specialized sigma24 family protein
LIVYTLLNAADISGIKLVGFENMKTRLSERTLIAVVQTRTRTGAETLYDQYAASLFKIIYCYVKDQQMAEDLLEQTFIHIWNTIDQFKEQPGGLHAWMLSIARNLSKSAMTTKTYLLKAAPTEAANSSHPEGKVVPAIS